MSRTKLFETSDIPRATPAIRDNQVRNRLRGYLLGVVTEADIGQLLWLSGVIQRAVQDGEKVTIEE